MSLNKNNYGSLDQYGRPIASMDSFGFKSDGPGMFSSGVQTGGFNTTGASLYSPDASIAGYLPSTALTQDFTGAGAGGKGFWDGMLGGKNADGTSFNGWGGLALGTAQGLFGGYMGMKNYGLAKQSLAQGKEQFERNYAAQKTTTNSRIADQYEARKSYAPSAMGSKEEYMKTRSIA